MEASTHEPPKEASSFDHYPRLPPIGAGAGLVLSAPAFASTGQAGSNVIKSSPNAAGKEGARAGAKAGAGALAHVSGVPLGLVTEVLSRTSADLARVIDFQARVADRQEPDVAHRDRAHQQYRRSYVVIGQLRVGDIFVRSYSYSQPLIVDCLFFLCLHCYFFLVQVSGVGHQLLALNS